MAVEQRILEQGSRLSPEGDRGVVTGWAALRWRGAAFFDGLEAGGTRQRPVEIADRVVETRLRATKGAVLNRHALRPVERDVVAGLPVASVHRALFDEIRRLDDLWAAVAAIDMTAAAELTSAWYFAAWLADANSRNGVVLARKAVPLSVDESRSPRETWLRLVWILMAGLNQPLVNQVVYDLDGRTIGTPDLLDPEHGLVAEYDGADHREKDARRSDVRRADRFADHGLEYVTIVGGESRADVAARLRAAVARAQRRPASGRRWTIERPPGVPRPETLDERLERLGRVLPRSA